MRKVALHNLGCKVNAYETEAMQQLLEERGYEVVPFAPGADVYIINTCTVTNIADRKSRQMLHKAKKMNPNAIVVAAGCYVQASKEDLQVDEAIDIIVGNNKKQDIITILEEYEADHEYEGSFINIAQTKEFESLSLNKTSDHTRAYVKVQDGCNQFCSYCIIPYARGRVRSKKSSEIVEEITALANNGYQEVVLAGIHLSSYGMDLLDEEGHGNKESLLSLILNVHEIPGIKRIRLSSLEPRIITEEFVKTISKLEKICPHFHLSLQSGCDETLKRMNRRYTSGEYYSKCQLLRKYFTNPAITTDVIVGFPQETDEEFQTTKAFLEEVEFSETHIFKYSMRKGTKAAEMDGQVNDQVKGKRSNELLRLNEEKQTKFERLHQGKEVEVLMEEQYEMDGKLYYVGHTKEYLKVAIPSKSDLTNQIIRGTIIGTVKPHILLCKKL
ncbi:MAG TPA: tRNA (N(6)-L-threonylcarbamoyladenosine(37)-C(2))-methylthiotransferase MtaB [Candidatus Merdenecus merdavium]|nr:tRNA (N(6)-L-threonylcarbamoyladenosine(37)-C(2))-methylthiotransferase MtaB [Candidatus Merdenecus merdavium]